MSRILEGLKAGDLVIVSKNEYGPDRKTREVLTREINGLLYRHVPEAVLVRALAVLRGEEGGA